MATWRGRNTKLVLNFALGRRAQATTDAFIAGLRHATANQHFHISTDGFVPYKSAIPTTEGDRCDFPADYQGLASMPLT